MCEPKEGSLTHVLLEVWNPRKKQVEKTENNYFWKWTKIQKLIAKEKVTFWMMDSISGPRWWLYNIIHMSKLINLYLKLVNFTVNLLP